jgi:hypothetical protein
MVRFLLFEDAQLVAFFGFGQCQESEPIRKMASRFSL